MASKSTTSQPSIKATSTNTSSSYSEYSYGTDVGDIFATIAGIVILLAAMAGIIALYCFGFWYISNSIFAVIGLIMIVFVSNEDFKMFGFLLYIIAAIASIIVLFCIGLWWVALIVIAAGIILISIVSTIF